MVDLADYEAWKARGQRASIGAANIVLGSVNSSPDEAAKDLQLGEEFAKATASPQPPMSLVSSNRPAFQRIADQARASTALSSSPMLAEWLRNPDNASVAADDLHTLNFWEGLGTAINRGVQGIGQSVAQIEANSIAQSYGDRNKSIGDIYAEEAARPGWHPLSTLLRTGDRFLNAQYGNITGLNSEQKAAWWQQQSAAIAQRIAATPMSGEAEAVRQKLGAISGDWHDQVGQLVKVIAGDPVGFSSFIVQTGVEFAPEIAAAAAATAATRNPALGAAFLGGESAIVNTGNKSLEWVQKAGHDLTTPEGALAAVQDPGVMKQAAERGQAYGLVVGALDGLSGGVAGKALAANPIGNMLLQMLVQAGLGGAGEAAGQLASGQQLSPIDIILEGLGEFATAPMEVLGLGHETWAARAEKARRGEAGKAIFQQLAGQAQESKLRDRLPSKFREWVDRATKDGPVSDVYVPANAWVTYWQSQGIDPHEIAASLGGVSADDLDTAIATGGDIKIPTATYAAQMAGSDHDAFMFENMKFDPNDYTAKEAAEFNARAQDALQEAYELAEAVRRDEETYRATETQIYEEMVSRLRSAGRATDVARTEAMLYPAFYRTMAERSGMPIEDFLAKFPLPQVRGEVPEGLKIKNVDALTRTLTAARNQRAVGIDNGQSLLEFIAARGGINDVSGELAARDAAVIKRGKGKKTLRLARKGFVAGMTDMLGGSTSNYSPDDVARAAVEAGFMADDPTVLAWKQAQRDGTAVPDLLPALWAAVDRELRGTPEHAVTPEQREAARRRDDLGAIEEYLAGLGRSLDDDDADIRAAIEADQASKSGDALKRYNQPAYHGTPHLFEKFSTSHIGTGEGAQAFGWGLYFAGKREVAEYYRKATAGRPGVKFGGKTVGELLGSGSSIEIERLAKRLGVDVGYSIDQHEAVKSAFRSIEMEIARPTALDITDAVELVEALRDDARDFAKTDKTKGDAWAIKAAVYDAILKDEKFAPKVTAPGRLMTVDIPGDDELLTWDAPLSEQPDGVKAKIKALVDGLKRPVIGKLDIKFTIDSLRDMVNEGRATGAEFYNRLGRVESGLAARDDAAASAALYEAGIPGHRYLDGGSRDSGKGSYNYVIYDGGRVSVTSFEQADGSGFGTGAGLGGNPRGMVQFPLGGIGNGDTIVSLFKSADLSTFIHESGHYFLAAMQSMAAHDPTGSIGADFGVVKDWWHANAEAVAKDSGNGVTADDVKLALDAGTSGDAAKDAAIDVGMQEQFARAFETYTMEGEAPSIGLRGVFEKFRAWLLSIYRRAAGLNVQVSDEMRSVFDRLLATDDEIQKARADAAATAPIFTSAEEMGVDQKTYDAFTKLYAQAQDEAAARVLREVMAPIKRAATKAYREERAKVRADVERNLKASPVYRAIQELRFGKDYDGKDVPALKLSRAAIEKDYGDGWVQHLPGATKDGHGHKNAVFANDGGAHPDMVAGLYGFPTGERLLDAMSKAPDLRDAIEAETDKIMRERHNDPLLDGSVQQAALDAVHNDKRGQVLALELKALNDIAGLDRGLTWKDAQESARRTIRTLKVRDAIRADRFLAAERRAGQEAQSLAATVTRQGMWVEAARRRVASTISKAVKTGSTRLAEGVNAKVDAANAMLESKDVATTRKGVAGTAHIAGHNENAARLVEAKRQQLLNHALYDEARRQSKAVDQLLRKTQRLNRPDAKQGKTRDIDYVKAARAVAARFGLARPERDFDFAMWLDQLRFDDPVSADSISHAIATYSQDARPFKDLTVAELGAVKDALDSLLETGKRNKLLEIEGQAVDREQAISELRDIIDQRQPAANAALSRKLTKVEKLKAKALSVKSSLLRMETWTRDMDDGKAGVFTRYLVKPVMDAIGRYRNDKAARLKTLLDIIGPRRAELLGKAIDAPELGYTFENKGELLHAILHTGNESNLEKLLLGRGWSGGFIDQKQRVTPGGKPSFDRKGNPLMDRGRVDTSKWDTFLARMVREGVVTKEDYDTAQAIWDLMDEIKRPAQAAHRKVFGYYFHEVEPRAVETPFGSYRGGYVPAIADTDASNDGQIRADQAAMEAQPSSFMFPTTGAGFTKARVQEYRTPLALNLMLLPAHMDKVLRFTHLNPVIRQTAGLVTRGELREAIDGLDRSIIPNLVTPWLQRTAQQAVETQPLTPAGRVASDFFRTMRKRVGIHTMFANFVNALQQVTGLSSAAVLVKPSRLKNALIRFTRGGAGDMRAEALQASAFMRDRIENSSRETLGRIQEAIAKPDGIEGFRAFVERHGYFVQQGAQNVIDVIAWHAALDQAVASGMDHAAAVYEADSVIRRTMGDFAPENVSLFETGNSFVRLFSMFYSYFNGQANLIGGEMQTAMRQAGWQGKGRMFYIYLMGMAIPAIVGEAIVEGFRGDLGDEDDDGWLDDIGELFFGSQLRYLAGMVPIVGPITNSLVNTFNGQFFDDRLSTSPVISTGERALGAPASVVKAATGHGKWSAATADTLTALGLILGVPTGQLAKWAGLGVGKLAGERA